MMHIERSEKLSICSMCVGVCFFTDKAAEAQENRLRIDFGHLEQSIFRYFCHKYRENHKFTTFFSMAQYCRISK